LIAPVEAELRERLGESVYGIDAETLEASLIAHLIERKLTIATAESITGGAVADALVSVPGASAAFRGGVVAYDNAIKTSLLGVDPALIAAHGAVSSEVAAAMAAGARDRLGADVAIATTGIAGPTGATPEKPVGLVWFGIAHGNDIRTRSVILPGDRMAVRRRAVSLGLDLAWRSLRTQESALS
jgi:nicotinamide-nucleotide amidase